MKIRFKRFHGETIAYIQPIDATTAQCYAHEGQHFEMDRRTIANAPTASRMNAIPLVREMQSIGYDI